MWRAQYVLLVAVAVAGTEDTHAACKQPGTIPDPEDAGSFLVCAGNSVLVARIRCPQGQVASLSTGTCEIPDTIRHRRRRQTVGAASAASASGTNGAAAGATAMTVSSGGQSSSPGSGSATLTVSGSTPGAGVCAAGPGARCRDCDTLVLCGAENGRPRELGAVSCVSSGTTCDAATHTCVQGGSCGAAGAGSAFQCFQEGAYPDPTDCTRYHLCIGQALTHYSDTCQLAFDPDKAVCAKDGPQCDNKDESPPACASPATQPAAFPNHRAFYRVCLPRAAAPGTPAPGARVTVLRCPDLQTFDPASASCKYSCEGVKRSRLPDPFDCRSFFDCPGDAATPTTPRRGTCTAGLAYEASRSMCVPESTVAACRSSPSAPASAPVSAPVPAPVPAPAVPWAATTATQASPVCLAECVYPGVFPDPYECRRYVTCSQRRDQRSPWRPGDPLERVVHYCPLFMYYSTFKSGCAIGFCGKM